MFTDAVVAPGGFETRIAPIVVTVGVAPEHVTRFPLSRTWMVPPETVRPARSFASMLTISARPTRSHVTAPAAAGASRHPQASTQATPTRRASLREAGRGRMRSTLWPQALERKRSRGPCLRGVGARFSLGASLLEGLLQPREAGVEVSLGHPRDQRLHQPQQSGRASGDREAHRGPVGA